MAAFVVGASRFAAHALLTTPIAGAVAVTAALGLGIDQPVPMRKMHLHRRLIDHDPDDRVSGTASVVADLYP